MAHVERNETDQEIRKLNLRSGTWQDKNARMGKLRFSLIQIVGLVLACGILFYMARLDQGVVTGMLVSLIALAMLMVIAFVASAILLVWGTLFSKRVHRELSEQLED